MRFDHTARRVLPRRIFLSIAAGLLGVGALCTSQLGAEAATLNTLYSFCAQNNCADGNMPVAGLVRDTNGNLFGTTLSDGVADGGVVFELAWTGSKYKFRQLYRFCSLADCADGKRPVGNLIVDTQGNLYGAVGGGEHGAGAIFRLRPQRGAWKLAFLYSFCSQANCTDGAYPAAGLIYLGAQTGALYDGSSPLFVTATSAGAGGGGTVLKLIPGKQGATGTVLYSFCAQQNCADGSDPEAPLTIDANGILYGTAAKGGVAGSGVAFELSPHEGSYKQTVLHSFCQLADCADGAGPTTNPLTLDANGELFGVTEEGGASGGGAIYKIHPRGARSTETVLHSFCAMADCRDGQDPIGSLAVDTNGDILGTTRVGGSNLDGTVFRLHRTKEKALYNFCDNCGTGAAPYSGVILDANGNMYGTTITGGANGIGGTVWELTP